jgi:hypothetical protein
MRFRFKEADDVATYGDRWWLWDEAAVLGLKGRELIAIEETVGPVLALLRGLRQDDPSTLVTMAVMWIAMTRAGREVAWDDFNPVVFTAEWEQAPAGPLDGGEAPAPDSNSSTAPPENAESLTS